VYCLFTKWRSALLSMRSTLSFKPKDSCNARSASVNRLACLYYRYKIKAIRNLVEFGEVDQSNEISALGRYALEIEIIQERTFYIRIRCPDKYPRLGLKDCL
jgi:hypothetical protein